MHQRFPGESRPIPTNQYLSSSESLRLLATFAVTVLPPGRSSTRTRMPGFSDCGNRTPHPNGLTSTVWQRAEKEIAGSRLVRRTGICARTRVPCRRWISSDILGRIHFIRPEIVEFRTTSHCGNESNSPLINRTTACPTGEPGESSTKIRRCSREAPSAQIEAGSQSRGSELRPPHRASPAACR